MLTPQSDKHIQLYTLRQRLTKRNRKIMAANGIEISGLQNDNELHDINDDYKSDDGGIDELYDSSWEDEMIGGGIFHEDI